MKKKKQQKNYLDLIPERSSELTWSADEEGIIVLEVENTGAFNRMAQKLFKKPKVTKVHMEKYGSFLWPLIDGEKTVMELADLQKEKMGNFVFLIVIIIAVLVLPLFGRDPAVQMEELVRSSRYGKRQLDTARIVAAYLTATVLYVCSMAVYFIIVMLPFGFDGASRPIQSNVRTFFSLYNITYLQQFVWNFFRGYVVLIFMVSLTLIVTILLKNILAGASVIAIFLVMLVIFNQVYLYPVNHWFANFMPVRMTNFWHFYVGNELYRICGFSISCMRWSIVISLTLSVIFLVSSFTVLYANRKKGLI